MDNSSDLITSIFGFKVLDRGGLSRAFRRGLKRLSERGFADESCTIIAQPPGPESAFFYDGGRYVPSEDDYEILDAMEEQGVPIPAMPFLIASSASILYHEWGHHVDNRWTSGNQKFSFFWFSQFYRINNPPSAPLNLACTGWRKMSSELFAFLFEDFFRNRARRPDICEPSRICSEALRMAGLPRDIIRNVVKDELLTLQPGITVTEIREQTTALFLEGLCCPVHTLQLSQSLFGARTEEFLNWYEEERDLRNLKPYQREQVQIMRDRITQPWNLMSLEEPIERAFEPSFAGNPKVRGRNDLCPCGSGKKYKKCCLK